MLKPSKRSEKGLWIVELKADELKTVLLKFNHKIVLIIILNASLVFL